MDVDVDVDDDNDDVLDETTWIRSNKGIESHSSSSNWQFPGPINALIGFPSNEGGV